MLKTLFSTAYYALFAVIVALAFLLVTSFFPFENWYQVKVVLSGSMEPAIHTGSVVIIKPAPSYGAGDVVTFGKDTRTQIPVTHRIMRVEESGAFITKGDANGDVDSGTITARDVIGKVWFSVPYLGYILDFTKTPTGFISLVVVPGILIVVGEVVKIVREVARMNRKKRVVISEQQ